jgi:hypothetical protein
MTFGVGAIFGPADAEPTVARLGELCSTLAPWDAGRFLPFTDRETEFSAAFDAATVERLRAAKRRYDPDGLFHASHAIGA